MTEFSMPPSGLQTEEVEDLGTGSEELPEPKPSGGITEIAPLTNEDREKFFECVVQDKPYSEYMGLMGGRMKILLRDRTTGEMDAIASQISLESPDKVIDWDRMLMKYMLAFSLEEIQIITEDTERTVKPFDDPKLLDKSPEEQLLLRAEVIKEFPQTKYFAFLHTLLKFNAKLDKLGKECISPDFFSETDQSI